MRCLPGTQYLIGSYMNSGVVGTATSFGTGQGGSGSFDPLLTNVFDQNSNFDSAFGFPGFSKLNAGGVWLGANFVYGVVPEPECWALMIAGFSLVGGAMRQRRRVNT